MTGNMPSWPVREVIAGMGFPPHTDLPAGELSPETLVRVLEALRQWDPAGPQIHAPETGEQKGGGQL